MAGAAPLLFTPGPLSVSPTVKEAMLRDYGSRDVDFLAVVLSVRQRLLRLARVPFGVDAPDPWTSLLLQGSGTYGVEAVISSVVPRTGGKLLVISNGAYGQRMIEIATRLDIPVVQVRVLFGREHMLSSSPREDVYF